MRIILHTQKKPLNIVSIIYRGQEAAVLAGTIGAAIIVGVLGLPLTAITWCGPGEPRTYRKTNLVGVPLHKQNFFIIAKVGPTLRTVKV